MDATSTHASRVRGQYWSCGTNRCDTKDLGNPIDRKSPVCPHMLNYFDRLIRIIMAEILRFLRNI